MFGRQPGQVQISNRKLRPIAFDRHWNPSDQLDSLWDHPWLQTFQNRLNLLEISHSNQLAISLKFHPESSRRSNKTCDLEGSISIIRSLQRLKPSPPFALSPLLFIALHRSLESPSWTDISCIHHFSQSSYILPAKPNRVCVYPFFICHRVGYCRLESQGEHEPLKWFLIFLQSTHIANSAKSAAMPSLTDWLALQKAGGESLARPWSSEFWPHCSHRAHWCRLHSSAERAECTVRSPGDLPGRVHGLCVAD